jgi:protein-disulfide isomerase
MKKKNVPFLMIILFSFLVVLLGNFFYFQKKDEVKQEGIEGQATYQADKDFTIPELPPAEPLELRIGADDYTLGASGSKVEIIVYDDPAEVFAPAYFETLKNLLKDYGDRVVLAIRPLPKAGDEETRIYSLAWLCAAQQGQYYQLYEEMLKANREESLTRSALSDIFSKLGLDGVKMETCMASGETDRILLALEEQADRDSIIGVPSTFINNHPLPGAYPLEDFKDSASYNREGLKSIVEKQLNSPQGE